MMIQDIKPGLFHNAYTPRSPEPDDVLCVFNANRVLADPAGDVLRLPRRVQSNLPDNELTYLFSMGQTAWYLAPQDTAVPGYDLMDVRIFRSLGPKDAAFGMITAYQLARWYDQSRFCGRCGAPLIHDSNERNMRCSVCGTVAFPQICPAVIVAVCDGDELLLTRYAGRAYKNYALIAGFCEIGETPEDTVHREVLEEVGLRVRDISYYKSQPWSLSSTLLMGFYARLDGGRNIRLDHQELSSADWLPRARVLDLGDDGISLTREMMRVFAEGNDPF